MRLPKFLSAREEEPENPYSDTSESTETDVYPEAYRTRWSRDVTTKIVVGIMITIALVLGGYVLKSSDQVSEDAPYLSPKADRSMTSGASASSSMNTTSGTGSNVRVLSPVSENEVRFGMAAPFSGPSKELGHEMALGLNAAFSEANEKGGIARRQIKLLTADDGYEPSRTVTAVAHLHDNDGVFGYIGNVGTPTAAVALPYALANHMLFFGAFTGADFLRTTPPDHYVFNYRPSYGEETEAVVKYLIHIRGLRPNEIAVFAQNDAFGDSGYNGVLKAIRASDASSANTILRMSYERNSLDLTQATRLLHARREPLKAVIMVASYRAAAKFIEAARPGHPDLLFTNVSFVGSTALANELKLLGPSYMDNVIVTQAVPDVEGYSMISMEYKAALARFFPGEAPDYVSFEAFIEGKILLEALRRTGRDLNTESLVNTLETMGDLEAGLGSPVSFTLSEHQASHKIWGTQLDRLGSYKSIELQ